MVAPPINEMDLSSAENNSKLKLVIAAENDEFAELKMLKKTQGINRRKYRKNLYSQSTLWLNFISLILYFLTSCRDRSVRFVIFRIILPHYHQIFPGSILYIRFQSHHALHARFFVLRML